MSITHVTPLKINITMENNQLMMYISSYKKVIFHWYVRFLEGYSLVLAKVTITIAQRRIFSGKPWDDHHMQQSNTQQKLVDTLPWFHSTSPDLVGQDSVAYEPNSLDFETNRLKGDMS